MRVRSLFVSDVHLGCGFSRAGELFDFLGRFEPDRLYLVGDIIDGWKLRRNLAWNDTASFVVRRILGMLKRGTSVHYVTGNHDEFLRPFVPHTFGHMELADQFIHETPSGERLLVIHGDVFDQLTKHARWVYKLGDRAYTAALHMNAWMNTARRTLGYPSWSLSSMLKSKVKSAVNFINDFEHFVARYTRQQGCTGVVCGHIHVPAIRSIDGIAYYNCGDWVEHCSALVEHVDGTMELLTHDAISKPDSGYGRVAAAGRLPLFPEAGPGVGLPEIAARAVPAAFSGLVPRG